MSAQIIFDKYIFYCDFSLRRIFDWLIYFIRWVHDNIVDVDFLFRVINNSKDVTMHHIVILTRSDTAK